LTPQGLKRTEDLSTLRRKEAENLTPGLYRNRWRGVSDRIDFIGRYTARNTGQCGSHRGGDRFIHPAKINCGVPLKT